jgi:short subunit dehydrogenase-like uncharacterized protein
MSRSQSWMLYGAAGYTGTLIAQHAHERGHRPLLAGRSAAGITALAEQLDLPHRVRDDQLAKTTQTIRS